MRSLGMLTPPYRLYSGRHEPESWPLARHLARDQYQEYIGSGVSVQCPRPSYTGKPGGLSHDGPRLIRLVLRICWGFSAIL